jgi:hypothetical protein
VEGQTDSTVAIIAKRQLAHDSRENEAQRQHAIALERDRHRRELLYEALGVVGTFTTLVHQVEHDPETGTVKMPVGIWDEVLPQLGTMRSKMLLCFEDSDPLMEAFNILIVALTQEMLEAKSEDGQPAKANAASLAALGKFQAAAREYLRLDDRPAPLIALS